MNQVTQADSLTGADTETLDRYWRAANYLSVGQIYLMANPLLAEPLRPEHIKPRLLGHWGTTPGLNFIWAHLNRAIQAHDAEMMIVVGPGHGGPAALANSWLEGSYSEVYPSVKRDTGGMRQLFRQFSFPGGVPSHISPETPGSIHEGGELGYSMSHAHGAAFDNPDLIVACVVGDGEAETGPLATSWHCASFPQSGQRRRGAADPAPERLEDRQPDGARPAARGRAGRPAARLRLRAGVRDQHERLRSPSGNGSDDRRGDRPDPRHPAPRQGRRRQTDQRWPLIVLRSPKGWTGPAEVDGLPVEGTWRAHQVPLAEVRTNPAHLRQLEEWLQSYRPDELFGPDGSPRPDLLGHVPAGSRRLGSTPHANGGRAAA